MPNGNDSQNSRQSNRIVQLAVKFELKRAFNFTSMGKRSLERDDRFFPFIKLSATHESTRSRELVAVRDPLKKRQAGERTDRFHGSSTCIGSGEFLLIAGHCDTSQGIVDRAGTVTQLDAHRGYFELNKSPRRTAVHETKE